jgi:hypothetical protein
MTLSGTAQRYIDYVNRHRQYVLEECEKLGVLSRGLRHDLSKFSVEEFAPYAQYFYGGYQREQIPWQVKQRFDRAWLLHQKRNDHHWQFWVLGEDSGATRALLMPEDAVREMVADWRGAGRAITGEDKTTEWYAKNREKMTLHPETREYVERLLVYNTLAAKEQ